MPIKRANVRHTSDGEAASNPSRLTFHLPRPRTGEYPHKCSSPSELTCAPKRVGETLAVHPTQIVDSSRTAPVMMSPSLVRFVAPLELGINHVWNDVERVRLKALDT